MSMGLQGAGNIIARNGSNILNTVNNLQQQSTSGVAGMPPKKEETLEEKIRRIRSKNMPNPPPPA
jgi:hypothetical protein